MAEHIFIETDRLILREWKELDRVPFAQMNASEAVMKYFPAPLSFDESDRLLERIISEFETQGFGLFAVELKSTGDFIGFVGFHRFDFDVPFSPGWEIAWRLSDRYWHKGYATEAATACIDFAREKRFCETLYSFTAITNHPSEQVMKRIGMQHIGHFRHPALPSGHPLSLHTLYRLPL